MERDIILTKINQKFIFPQDLEEVCSKNAAKLILKFKFSNPGSRPSIKVIIESQLIPRFLLKQIYIQVISIKKNIFRFIKYKKGFLQG